MREPLEKEHVFQTPERRELHDLFQVLGKCSGHRLQVVRNLPIAVDFSHNKCLFKDGDKAEPGNYCPISLHSVFNRLFEKIMYNRLKSFFSKHCLFYESQYSEPVYKRIASPESERYLHCAKSVPSRQRKLKHQLKQSLLGPFQESSR